MDTPRHKTFKFGDGRVGVAQGFALVDQLAGDRDVALVYGFLALEVGHDCQDGGEQDQHGQRGYHGPDKAAGPPLLADILAFDFFLGNLTDGRRQCGDLVPEPGIAQGQARVTAGPAHVDVLGLGREYTAQRRIPSGGGGAEITSVVVPGPAAIGDHD